MFCSLKHLGHWKNRFLVYFRLLVFVSDTCMFNNRFLVCFGLLVFSSDTYKCLKIIYWCVLVVGFCICVSLMFKNRFLVCFGWWMRKNRLLVCFWLLVSICSSFMYANVLLLTKNHVLGVFMFVVFISTTCIPNSYSINHLDQ